MKDKVTVGGKGPVFDVMPQASLLQSPTFIQHQYLGDVGIKSSG
jgi:hypothetical protein